MPEKQRLLCSWTMDLAAFLRKKHNMDKKRALELAHLNRELLTRLGTGRVWLYIVRLRQLQVQRDAGTEASRQVADGVLRLLGLG